MKKFIYILFPIFFWTCQSDRGFLFEYLDETSGIDFVNKVENTSNLHILNYLYFYNGAGLGVADFNNDGLLDLYFAANTQQDRLYLNKGKLVFEDITFFSKIINTSPWTQGVSCVDINQDGWMDIYLSKVSGIKNIKGRNQLWVNQGLDANGRPFFKEMAKKYALDIRSLSTQASFMDIDADGDLDLFLMNHATHPNKNYGKGYSRRHYDPISGDKLLIRQGDIYKESKHKIFQSKIGFGLGLGIGDLNNDNYPDIYVGNDFFENDYLYLNDKKQSFTELISQDDRVIGHSTHFSMGNYLADINNDSWVDIISLDMLPRDIQTYLKSGLEYPFQTYMAHIKRGYGHQYMQNTLHINQGNNTFMEIAFLAGIPATDWSWAPLVADFDNDGLQDIFISNGIKGATNDMDFINLISNKPTQDMLKNPSNYNKILALIKQIPEKKLNNYFFKNKGNFQFEDVSSQWVLPQASFSHGSVYADLDSDGDLDIITNNMNQKAFIYENKSNEILGENNYLDVRLKGNPGNRNGIGAKVILKTNQGDMIRENFPVRGYLSSVSNNLHFGLGKRKIEAVKVIWPKNRCQILYNIAGNQSITLVEARAKDCMAQISLPQPNYLSKAKPKFNFKHKDGLPLDYVREPLIPYNKSNQGPGIASGDVNNDGLTDILITAGKHQTSQLFIQEKDRGGFYKASPYSFTIDSVREDVDAVFFDADGDYDDDLIIVSGGNEFKRGEKLQPLFYKNIKGRLVLDKTEFKNIFINASKVKAIDIDNDFDLDICIISNIVPQRFGKTPLQYIFSNDGKGNFKNITFSFAPEWVNLGNVEDIKWVDIDNNKFLDAIVLGYWMPIQVFLNDGQKLQLQETNGLSQTHGWWNTVEVADFDNDGDMDILAGNWGLNTRLTASPSAPITLYMYDFDKNRKIDPIITYFYGGKETLFATKPEIDLAFPMLKKKFETYHAFSQAKLEDIFPSVALEKAKKKYVYMLESAYLENNDNQSFSVKPLPRLAQASSIRDIMVHDFNKDGYKDALVVGNHFHNNTQLGRSDALHGKIMFNDKKGGFKISALQHFDISGAARNILKVKIGFQDYIIVTINNQKPVFLSLSDGKH